MTVPLEHRYELGSPLHGQSGQCHHTVRMPTVADISDRSTNDPDSPVDMIFVRHLSS